MPPPASSRAQTVAAIVSGLTLPLSGDAWLAEREAWKHDAESRVGRYSPEFVLDDSREAIYREREDAQL